MVSHRPIMLLLLLFVLLIGTASPAMAAYDVDIVDPEGQITAPTPFRISVTRGGLCPLCDPVPSEVEAGMFVGGAQIGRVSLTCIGGCRSGQGSESTWGDPDTDVLQPSGAPFPVTCNGKYGIRARVNGSYRGSAVEVYIQQPPVPATGVTAVGEVGNVNVSWNAVSGQGVFGITVSRKANGATSFTPLLSTPLPTSATSFVDTTVKAEDLPVAYAVTVFRHDGKVNGAWAQACDDTSTTLQQSFTSGTFSIATADGQVVAPSPSPTGSPTPSEGPSGNPTTQPTTPTGPRQPPDRGLAGGDQGSDDEEPPDQPTIDLPDRPAPPPPSAPRYYGDNLGFDELLDFGDQPPITAPTTPGGDDMAFDSGDEGIAVDVETASDGGIDTEALLEPFALGLLLLSLAMHVRRWMNA